MGYSKFGTAEFSGFSDSRVLNIKKIRQIIQNFEPNFRNFLI